MKIGNCLDFAFRYYMATSKEQLNAGSQFGLLPVNQASSQKKDGPQIR